MTRPIRKTRHTTRIALNLVAMIDVVFLLLIFFMCVNEWRVPEASLPATIPTGTGRQQDDVDPKRDLPFIRIEISGNRDDISIRVQERPVADMDDLSAHLIGLAGIDRSVPVVIDARGSVSFRWVIRALNACLRADLDNVAFTTPARSVQS